MGGANIGATIQTVRLTRSSLRAAPCGGRSMPYETCFWPPGARTSRPAMLHGRRALARQEVPQGYWDTLSIVLVKLPTSVTVKPTGASLPARRGGRGAGPDQAGPRDAAHTLDAHVGRRTARPTPRRAQMSPSKRSRARAAAVAGRRALCRHLPKHGSEFGKRSDSAEIWVKPHTMFGTTLFDVGKTWCSFGFVNFWAEFGQSQPNLARHRPIRPKQFRPIIDQI